MRAALTGNLTDASFQQVNLIDIKAPGQRISKKQHMARFAEFVFPKIGNDLSLGGAEKSVRPFFYITAKFSERDANDKPGADTTPGHQLKD